MSTIITIFKNLGTIVILLFQIGYVSIIDYMSLFDKPKPKQSDTKNKTVTKKDVSSNNEPLRDVNFNPNTKTISEKQESLERSHRMVEWSENPHYSTTNTKHEPE